MAIPQKDDPDNRIKKGKQITYWTDSKSNTQYALSEMTKEQLILILEHIAAKRVQKYHRKHKKKGK